MLALISDARFDSLTSVVLGAIAIIPATLAAFWARSAKHNSDEAKANSAEAKLNSAQAAHEVSTNGGMSDPNPNLNDHVKYQTEMTEFLVVSMKDLRKDFDDHLKHSAVMDQAVAELYLEIRPGHKTRPEDNNST
jgi:hypothetical protein